MSPLDTSWKEQENKARAGPSAVSAAAEYYRVKEGDTVFVESLRGRITVTVKCTTSILPGIISMSPGWEKANANLLTNDDGLDPVTGFPAARSLLARITRTGP